MQCEQLIDVLSGRAQPWASSRHLLYTCCSRHGSQGQILTTELTERHKGSCRTSPAGRGGKPTRLERRTIGLSSRRYRACAKQHPAWVGPAGAMRRIHRPGEARYLGTVDIRGDPWFTVEKVLFVNFVCFVVQDVVRQRRPSMRTYHKGDRPAAIPGSSPPPVPEPRSAPRGRH
jgi:hypothetical protein